MDRNNVSLPLYDPQKLNLPKRSEYVGSIAWLRAVTEYVGEPIIFALDQALMCQQYFSGRNEEYLLWVYGCESLSRFNGIVVLGNELSYSCIIEKNGLQYTSFNKTINDAIAYEAILDMQGITEALNKYYHLNNKSFEGVTILPEHKKRFETLASEAVNYYNY